MALTLCIRETPKRGTFTNSEDSDEMPHSALYVKVTEDLQTKEYNIFLKNNPTPLDMYKALSQVDCFKPEGRILSTYTKG